MSYASIIIPTYQGVNKLEGCLRNLQICYDRNFEVVVVIDGSTDGTKLYLEENGKDFDFPLQYIVQDNRGRAAARNSGVLVAKGDLLVFLDDDMRVSKNTIKEHVVAHERHAGIVVGQQVMDVSHCENDFCKFLANRSRAWTEGIPVDKPLPQDKLFLTAANMSVNKGVFNEIGKFDERLIDAEDFELAVRALELGVPIYYQPLAAGTHFDHPKCRQYIKRVRQYREAHLAMKAINPSTSRYFDYQKYDPPKFKRFFFSLFKYSFWITWVDRDYLRKFLPRLFRYKFYDWIITAQTSYYPTKVV